MLYICIAFAIIVPYLICSINPAIIAAKIKAGKDIREMGSGNPGLTNTLRTMGKGAAAAVLIFDILKGVISILAVQQFYMLWFENPLFNMEGATLSDFLDVAAGNHEYFINYNLCSWVAGLSAVFGHCYPIYHKFKGGKAVLVTASTGIVICGEAALIALALFIIIVLITKYVSLGSIISAALYAVCVFIFGNSTGGIFASAIAVILIFKHRENIKRLTNGTEKKLGKKEKADG